MLLKWLLHSTWQLLSANIRVKLTMPSYANQLRRRRSRPGDTWHLDEALRVFRYR
jgi:hypothetical protein